MSLVKKNSFTHDSVHYYCDLFSFLSSSVPDKTTATNTPIRITCFDVSADVIVFGSNIGLVYGYRRRKQILNEPHFKFCLNINSAIHHVVILSSDLIVFATPLRVFLYSLPQGSSVWESDEQTSCSITAVKAIIRDNSIHILVGDSGGKVVQHVIQCSHPHASHTQEIHDEAKQLQQEEENQDPGSSSNDSRHKHEIVQIDVMDVDNVYLISSCYRSIIVTPRSHSDDGDVVSSTQQVGRNQRKVCGKYGAVYCPDQRVICASRPSSHLIRASAESGQAMQTFILKRAEKPPVRKIFADVRMKNKSSADGVQMGRLMQVTKDLLLSFTTRSLTLLTTRGSLVMDENSLIPVIDVSCIRSNDSDFEVFILFNDRSLVRMRNVDQPVLTSSSSSSDADPDPSSLIDGMINKLIPHAFSFPVMSSILATFELANTGEIRMKNAANDKMMQESMIQEENGGEEVKLFSLQDSNSQEDAENDPPLVTRKKVRRKSNDSTRTKRSRESRVKETRNGMTRTGMRSNASSDCSLTVSRISIFSVTTAEDTHNGQRENRNSSNTETMSDGKESESPEAGMEVDENEKLMQILNAYREKAGIPKIVNDDDLTVIESNDRIETSEALVPESIEQETGKENRNEPMDSVPEERSAPEHCASDGWSLDLGLRTETMAVSYMKELETGETNQRHPHIQATETSRTYATLAQRKLLQTKDSSIRAAKWDLKFANKNDVPFDITSVISISAFTDSEDRDGLAMLSVSDETGDACIHIRMHSGWKKIPCPRSVTSSVKAIHVDVSQILLLYQDGSLFRCTNWSRSRFFNRILRSAPSFRKLSFCRTRSLVSLSVNTMDSVCWSCDEDGVAWLMRLDRSGSGSSCILVRDDCGVRVKDVVVSPCNSAVVWALDEQERVYCRAGIFNEKSDRDSLIAGIDWVPVEDLPPGQLLLMTASSDSVCIISRSEGQERLFRRSGIRTPVDCIGSHWQQYELPVQSGIQSISASSTGELWIMTDTHAVYQHCPHDGSSFKSVENGWLLL